jgi:AcrR family transcriptional regulator
MNALAEGSGPFAMRNEGPTPLSLGRLPIGRHGLSREFVAQNHRNRLMAGAVQAIGEHGYAAGSVAAIIKVAGVSRNTFYEHFADKEACFLAAYEVIVAWLEREGAAAAAGAGDWPGAVKAAVAKTVTLLGADLGVARLATVEISLAGPAAAAAERALVDRLAAPLRLGRAEGLPDAALSARLEPALIGGALSLVARAVGAGQGDRLAELAPGITEFLLVPYLGAMAAARAAGGRN